MVQSVRGPSLWAFVAVVGRLLVALASTASDRGGTTSLTLPHVCAAPGTANCLTQTPVSQCPATDLVSGVRHGSSPLTINPDRITPSHAAPQAPTVDAAITSASTTTTASALPSVTAERINDAESLSETGVDTFLDKTNFLSFEEWKIQNLAKAGQSVQHYDHGKTGQAGPARLQTAHEDGSLDSIGEDGEIELPFRGFGGDATTTERGPDSSPLPISASGTDAWPSQHTKNKDAGKTSKERFNYASFDCAANVLKTNPRCKSASAILVENKDRYMLNECAVENKFIIVELCDDILVDTVVLANFEFFSSMFRTFRISVSDKYPVKADRWKELGTYEARSSREIQAFLVENPIIWARYLRIEFLTQYGTEFYCPVSLLRVHGTTMMAEFRHQEELARGETDDEDEDEVESSVSVPAKDTAILPLSTSVVHVSRVAQTSEDLETTQSDMATTPVAHVEQPTVVIDTRPSSVSTEASQRSDNKRHHHSTDGETQPARSLFPDSGGGPRENLTSSTDNKGPASAHINSSVSTTANSNSTSSQINNPVSYNVSPGSSAIPIQSPSNLATSVKAASTYKTSTQTLPSQSIADAPITVSSLPHTDSSITTSVALPVSSNSTHISVRQAASAGKLSASSDLTSPPSQVPISTPSISSADSSAASTISFSSIASSTSSFQRGGSVASSISHSAQAPSPPATQESFFKSIHKRLQNLEANTSLSLQYIELQSQLLRDAFGKVERRNLARTTMFLEALNASVTSELARFKSDYDALWHTTVLELAAQREDARREASASADHVRLLADEIISQKRLMAVQAILLLLCLGLVIFARVGAAAGLDVGFVPGLTPRGRDASGRMTTATVKGDLRRRRFRWDSPWSTPVRDVTESARPGVSSEDDHGRASDEDRRSPASGSAEDLRDYAAASWQSDGELEDAGADPASGAHEYTDGGTVIVDGPAAGSHSAPATPGPNTLMSLMDGAAEVADDL